MQSLVWCFFGWRGYLTRQEYALALLVIILAGFVITPVMSDLMIGPTNDGAVWTRADLDLAKAKATLTGYLLTAWPTLAIQVKRLRHIGYPPQYLIGANIALTVVLLIAPALAIFALIAGSLYLFLAKGRAATQPDS